MRTDIHLSFFTLLLLISFASVNAVMFTPALPHIASFFAISNGTAQQTITWFLIGYTLGQLIYGPIANRFGRKPALYVGISLQIFSSLLCILAGKWHDYSLLVIGRFLLALGSSVGLKITFTLINETYEPKIASQKIAYLMLAFAITPGLSIALGGILNTHFGWMSCFYASAVYGLIVLALAMKLPETLQVLDLDSFKLKHLLDSYYLQFKNISLVAGALLMGGCAGFVYVLAALAPFIAINLYGMNSAQYGIANILPPIGLIVGSICSANLVKFVELNSLIRIGITIACIGSILMLLAVMTHLSVTIALFLPMIIIYFGTSMVLGNTSVIAMSSTADKAHGSAVMNFINMGFATLLVLSLQFFTTTKLLLPFIYIALALTMAAIFKWLIAPTQ